MTKASILKRGLSNLLRWLIFLVDLVADNSVFTGECMPITSNLWISNDPFIDTSLVKVNLYSSFHPNERYLKRR